MRTIAQGNAKVRKLLGKQRFRDTKYRLMKYVLRAEIAEGTLLHNVITGQLVLLDSDETDLLDHLPEERSRVTEALKGSWFLVPVDYREKTTVDQLRILMKRVFAVKGINNYLILTTTNCNARCPYCFENGVRRINMDSSTADRVVDYIISRRSKDEVFLHWFGGEPLLGISRIDQICRELKTKSISFKSVMTSNGYLFSEDLIRRAAEDWNLKTVQITLDGTEEVYNKVKGYVCVNRSEESPYRKVLGNIGYLLNSSIHVTVRLNAEKQNVDNLKSLITELHETFNHAGGNLDVYAAGVSDEYDFIGRSSAGTSDDDVFDSLNELNDYIRQFGLYSQTRELLSLKTNSCMADSDETVVIFPDGRLSKCETIRDEYTYGHIVSEEVRLEAQGLFKEVLQLGRCGDCPLYPVCILLKNCPVKKNAEQKDCQKSIQIYQQQLTDYYQNTKKNPEC